jgi:hypothetical protein
MTGTWFDDAALPAVVAQATGERPVRLAVSARRLTGGLESSGVAELTLRYLDERGRPRVQCVIAKRLEGTAGRELAVYEQVVVPHAAPLAPRLLHVARDRAGVTLFLEAVRTERRWPWRDTALAALALRSAAALHASPCVNIALPEWDYDAELEQRAGWVLSALAGLPPACGLEGVGPFLPAVRRVSSQLRRIRTELAAGPLQPAMIHGDLHPGNVVVRRSAVPSRRLALLDWGRARIGSPLEDVSSWLTSIAYWEPAARQRHDTLLGAYLSARGLDPAPTRALRDAYWLAGASNAFAGALLHHLQAARGAGANVALRDRAAHSARDWLRVIRRADEVWSSGRPPGARGGLDRRTGAAAPDPRPSAGG